MAERVRAEFALVDPPILTKGVFRPLAKAAVREKLDVSIPFADSVLHWRGPDQLGALEQSVLLGVLAIAGQRGVKLHAAPVTRVGAQLRSALQLEGAAVDAPAALVQASWSAVARASGVGRGGGDLAAVRAALARLAEVTVWISREDTRASTRLLTYQASDGAGVAVAINYRLAAAIFAGQFIRVSLEERRALSGDTARILHGALSSMLRVSRKASFSMLALEAAVYGGTVGGRTGRDRRRRIESALHDIGRLPGWLVQTDTARGQAVVARLSATSTASDAEGGEDASSGRVESASQVRGIAVQTA